MGDKEGQNGIEYRLQTEDDPHVGGSGILEGDSLDEKGRSGAEKGKDQHAAPHRRAAGEGGGLKDQRQDQHAQTGKELLVNAQLEGVDLLACHAPLGDQQVGGVGDGA